MDDEPRTPPEATEPYELPTIADPAAPAADEPPYAPAGYFTASAAPAPTHVWPATPPLPRVAGPPGGGPGWAPPPDPTPPARRLRALAVGAAFLALVLISAAGGAFLAVAVRDPEVSSSASAPTTTPSALDPFGGSDNSGPSGTLAPEAEPLPEVEPNAPAPANSLDVDAIAGKVNPGIVDINTTLANSGGQAAGTGMVLTGDGQIVTNNHVIRNAVEIRVTLVATGEVYPAHVIGYSVNDDVALLKIDGVSGIDTVTIGNSSGVAVNDPIVAIGNALGRGGTPTATPGVVTAVDQTITAGDTSADTETLTEMIEIEAAIRPGDSGGALVDANARVIGMNTAADAANGRFGQQSGGIGFAIAINKVMSIVHDIADGNESERIHIGPRALLGVEITNANTAGAGVTDVAPGGPAEAAGITAGSRIVMLDDRTIESIDDLNDEMRTHHPGDEINVEWLDSFGTRQTATVTLTEGPPE